MKTFIYLVTTLTLLALPVWGAPLVRLVPPPLTDPLIVEPGESQHVTALDLGVDQRKGLFVFLPGTNQSPEDYQLILRRAAIKGFHAVGLKYVNEGDPAAACCESSPFEECYERWRMEKIDGDPVHPKITIDRANSIENRLVRLIEWLQLNFPGEGWGRFLGDDDKLKWEIIAIGGHEQGAGHAALMAKTRQVRRCLLFSGLDWWLTETRVPDWMTDPGLTPVERFYGFVHVDDATADTMEEKWMALGMDAFGGGELVGRTRGDRYHFTHQLLTDFPLSGAEPDPEGSTVRDDATPLSLSGLPLFAPEWDYMLVSPYLPPPDLDIEQDGSGNFKLMRDRVHRDFLIESSDRLGGSDDWEPVMTESMPEDAELVSTFDGSKDQGFFRLRDLSAPSSSLAPIPGVHTFVINVDEHERLVQIVIPPGYDSESPVPLVLAFHGSGQSSETFRTQHPDLTEEAAMRNMVLVFPQALPNEVPGDNRNAWVTNPDDARDHSDLLFIDDLIIGLKERLNIDEQRIYALGFSNGGNFVYTLAQQRPGLLAAIALAGSSIGWMDLDTKMLVMPDPAPEAVPVMIIHGRKDKKRPWDGKAYDPADGGTAIAPVADAVSYWTLSNGYPGGNVPTWSESLQLGDVNIAYFLNDDPSYDRSDVVFVGLERARHIWPDGIDNVGFDANKQVLSFFERWTLAGEIAREDSDVPTEPIVVADPTTATPIDHCHELTMWDQGCERSYYLYIPEGYDGSSPAPMVYALHGGTGNARNYAKSHPDLFDYCSAEGWFIVYPNGTTNPVSGKNNWSNTPVGVVIDDVVFLQRLHEKLAEVLNIREGGTFGTGFSAGGAAVMRVAAESPGVFDAAAPVGSPFGWNHPDTGELILPAPALTSTPILLTYGRLDRRRPWDGGVNDNCHFTASVDQLVDFWLDANGCSGTGTLATSNPIDGIQRVTVPGVCMEPAQTVELSGHFVNNTTWDQGVDGNVVILNDLGFMGHSWMDQDDLPSEIVFDLNREIVDFFKGRLE